MYSKAEKSNIKKEFWTSFGLYMKPVLNAAGERINWINYKTDIKHIYLRMDAGTKHCSAAVEIKTPAIAERKELFQKFISLKNIFADTCGNDWLWIEETYDDDGAAVSKIYHQKENLNIFIKEDWPAIISFLKERMIQLDSFWAIAKTNFE